MASTQQFIFFDFEMLCSNRGMAFTDMEAIRLGAVKYDLKTEKVEFFDRYIKPRRRKPLSNFCKQLTGINDADLMDAQNFKEVFSDFLAWIGGVKRSRFFSWSPSDLIRLKLDAESHEISPSTIKKIEQRYVDFQAIFTKRVTGSQFSVENALSLYGLSFEGETHNPMYDAYNTLRIYLAFANEPVESDLIMVKQYIIKEVEIDNNCDVRTINTLIKEQFHDDMSGYMEDLKIICKLKDAKKLLKRTQRMVNKYENILFNRSDLFDTEIQEYVRLLTTLYHDLVNCYEEHLSHDSKIIILHDHIYQPIKKLSQVSSV